MPEVRVKYDDAKVNHDQLATLSQKLGSFIATHLSCDGGNLNPEDIALSFSAYNKLDRHQNDLEIIIDAFIFPERLTNLQDRTDKIFLEVNKILGPGISYFIWTRLSEGGFSSTNQ